MTLLTRHKNKDSPYFQMKIIILIALRGVKFPEGGAAAPVAPPLDTPLKTPGHIGRVVFFGEQSGDVCHPYSWFDKIKSRDFIDN